MPAYWLLLILGLGGLFAWTIYKLIAEHTSWPTWMKAILSVFYGLSISGLLVLVVVVALSSSLPQTFTLSDRWQSCDPAYPDVCIPPGPPDLDCADLPYAHFRVLWPDPHHLDADGNGIGCEY